MDSILIISIGFLTVLFSALVYFLYGAKNKDGQPAAAAEARPGGGARAGAQPVVRAGVRRAARGGPRRRLNQQAGDADEDEVDEDDAAGTAAALPEEKIGAKKQRKLEEKAQRKAQREAEQAEREERKKQDERNEQMRKKEEQRLEAEEAARELEEKKLKEEQEKREYEEYLKLKSEFSVEEEGTDALPEEDMQSLLQEFISYIKRMKVVMIEDVAAHFKIRTQDAIDRIKALQADGTLSGVIDDRGKFVYITQGEYEAVARFIKQRGRVSITELAESMNRLINLNPDNSTDQLPSPLNRDTSTDICT